MLGVTSFVWKKKIDLIIDAHYEDIAAVDDEEPTAELTKQVVKEIVKRDETLMLHNNISSIK